MTNPLTINNLINKGNMGDRHFRISSYSFSQKVACFVQHAAKAGHWLFFFELPRVIFMPRKKSQKKNDDDSTNSMFGREDDGGNNFVYIFIKVATDDRKCLGVAICLFKGAVP